MTNLNFLACIGRERKRRKSL